MKSLGAGSAGVPHTAQPARLSRYATSVQGQLQRRRPGIGSHAADSRTALEITDPEYPGVSEDRVPGYLYPLFTALRTWRYLWRHSRPWTYCLALRLRISSNSVLINSTVDAILSLSLALQASEAHARLPASVNPLPKLTEVNARSESQRERVPSLRT
eukprot:1016642-Rhodomonas_salina.1